MELLIKVLVCFFAGAGAGIGTGFAGMSAAAVVGPMLVAFLGVPAYDAVGIGLISDVLASAVSAYTYRKNGNLDIKNSLPMMISVLVVTVIGSLAASYLPERTMGGTMQIALIIIGLRFILKPVTTTKEQMAAGSPREKLIKSILGGVFCRLHLRLCGRGRGNDDAVRAHVLSGVSDAHGGGYQRVHNGVYRPDRRSQPFCHRRSSGYNVHRAVRGVYAAVGEDSGAHRQ